MKIYSKERDYYDSAVSFGIDPELHFYRTESINIIIYTGSWNSTQEFDFPNGYNYQAYRDSNGNLVKPVTDFHIIGFCGQLYPLAHCQDNEGEYFFYNYKDYKTWKTQFKKEYSYRRYSSKSSSKQFFDRYSDFKNDKTFIEYNTPVFIVSKEYLTSSDIPEITKEQINRRQTTLRTNILLKEFQFYKIKDSYSAFQEISIYVGNQLAKEPEILEISDKYKIQQHGFDKDSFRNPIKIKDL